MPQFTVRILIKTGLIISSSSSVSRPHQYIFRPGILPNCFYLEPILSIITAGTHPVVFQVHWVWNLVKIQVLQSGSISIKSFHLTNNREFSIFFSFVKVPSTARKAAKHWDNREQHSTYTSLKNQEWKAKRKDMGKSSTAWWGIRFQTEEWPRRWKTQGPGSQRRAERL